MTTGYYADAHRREQPSVDVGDAFWCSEGRHNHSAPGTLRVDLGRGNGLWETDACAVRAKARSLIAKSACKYIWVDRTSSLPSRMAITDASTPARRSCIATVCRWPWGVRRFRLER